MLGVVFLAVLAAAPQPPQPERLHVEWVAPDGCPGREELRASLEADVPANHTFHASVRIDEPASEGEAWQAVVVTTVDGAERQRVVHGADCARASAAAVLVITLAATDLPTSKTPRAQLPESAEPPATPPATPAVPTAGGVDAAEPFTFRLRVQPVVGANLGLFPLPGFSLGAAASLSVGRVRALLAVAGWLRSQSPAHRVSVGLTSFRSQGCWLYRPVEAWHVGPCGGAEAGVLEAQGVNITAPARNSVFWVALLGGATGGYSLTRSISVWASANLGLNLVRPRFSVSTPTGPETVFAVGWLMGRVTLGLEVELSIP